MQRFIVPWLGVCFSSLLLLACGSSTSTGTTGSGGSTTGGSCSASEPCGADEGCFFPVTACGSPSGPSTPNFVVGSTGTCKALPATCTRAADCTASAPTCNNGTCGTAVDYCTTKPSCPVGCTFTAPWPCACVCPQCPP